MVYIKKKKEMRSWLISQNEAAKAMSGIGGLSAKFFREKRKKRSWGTGKRGDSPSLVAPVCSAGWGQGHQLSQLHCLRPPRPPTARH